MKPIVSVKTITFNHAPYIRRCIESILMQKTTFPFELVIGEDCSTDGTRDIVLDYAKKYPDVIRIITSETNVGEIPNEIRTGLACQGEYIALCEGDDYWIDPLKLQKQYDVMLKHDAVVVTHRTIYLEYQGNKFIRSIVNQPRENSGVLRIEDIILNKFKCHTSSIFFRTKITKEFPEWYYKVLTGLDIPFILLASSIGKIYFINEIMSVYQNGVTGSWTFEQKKKLSSDESWRQKFEIAYLEMYKNFDKFTKSRYTKVIQERIHDRIIKYYTNYRNLDFLEISERKKKSIRMIAAISRIAPGKLRYKITRKIVEKVTHAYFG
jgi:glycosyltransferase involved in cell wall biosynthesis